MKRALFLIIFLLSVIAANADKDVRFYMDNGEVKCVAVERIDSISFDEEADILRVALFDKSADIRLSSIDSIAYGILPSAVSVTYCGERAVVENPFAFDSLEVAVTGAKVVVKSRKQQEVDYVLQGASNDGCFKLYGVKKYNVYLNGVVLANASGAAINSQCGKRGRIFVMDGTVNSISDSPSYNFTSGEDEKGAFFSEGQLIFEGGGGELLVSGNYKHAICSDDYIEVRGGNIRVSSAVGDAMHANDSIVICGGTVDLTSGDEGMDCEGVIRLSGGRVDVKAAKDDAKGIKAAGEIIIDGADVDVFISGDVAKGIKSSGALSIKEGNVTVEATGNTILVDGSPSYAVCLKCDSTVNITGGNVTLTASGIAGRGISADVDVNIADGTTAILCSGESKSYDPSTAGDTDDSSEPEQSYVLYVNIPSQTTSNRPGGTSSNVWKNLYLYEANGTLIATLTNSVVVNGTTFFYYDFGTESAATYYLKSDDYSSFRGTYTIQSETFNALEGDRYYQVSSNYSTSGSVRTYALSDVTSGYEGGSVSSDSSNEDSYAAAGIKCDGNFSMSGGVHSITVSGSESKGVKVEGDIVINGGALTVSTSGTAKIVAYDPSYCTAIKCDGEFAITDGDIDIVATGQGGMGISADGVITMDGGKIDITISGAGSSYTASTGTDYYSTKCLKGDVAVNLLAGTLNCRAKGNGSKAIVASGLLTIGKEGALDDALVINAITQGASLGTSSGSTGGGWGGGMGGMHDGFNAAPKAIKGAANVVVNSGTIYAETAYDGGEGVESKATMTVNGGVIECNTYDDGINATTALVFNGGYVYSHASNNDGIDSNGTITVNGGVVLASGANAPEEGFDCDNNQFVVNGGVLIGTGSANSSVTSASQPYATVSSVTVSQGKYLTVKDSSGNVMFSYKCPNTVNSAKVLLSSSEFTSSSYTLMYGVTSVSGASESCFGGSFMLGGTATGGTLKTFTPQSR